MKLEEALRSFRHGKQAFPKSSLDLITQALGDVATSEFIVKGDFVADTSDQFHIHPTMIVARIEFPGSINRGPEPYPTYPHFLALPLFTYTSTTAKSSAIDTTVCPVTYARQPAHVICPTCETLH